MRNNARNFIEQAAQVPQMGVINCMTAKVLLTKSALSLKEIADRCEFSEVELAKILDGTLTTLTTKEVHQLSKALGVSFSVEH